MNKKIKLLTLALSCTTLLFCGKNDEDKELQDLFNDIEQEQTKELVAETPQSVEEIDNTVTPEDVSSTYLQMNDPDGDYVIQLYTFKRLKFVKKAQQKLSDLGIPSFVTSVSQPTKDLNDDLYHQVKVGYFSGLSVAKRFAKENLSNYKYWVDSK